MVAVSSYAATIPVNIGLTSTCSGPCSYSLTANPTGTPPYNYVWTPAAPNAATISGLCAGAGTYSGKVTDSLDNTGTASKTLPPVDLVATQSQVNLTCNGVCTGSATVVASGGVAPYTYSWAPSGGSGATASSLCSISYTVT